MQIIPAIDIIDGKCVRLSQGDYDQKKVYNENPLAVAKQFESYGVKKLHLVDLDGAKAKRVINYTVLDQIAKNTQLEIEFGGGIKSDEDIQRVFDSGATQAIIGTIAVKEPETFFRWLDRYGPERVILGADVKNEKLAINGWLETSEVSIFDFLKEHAHRGVKHVICTDISKDGMLQGTSVHLYEKLMQVFPQMNIIASGGVSSNRDIEQLKAINCPAVVVGKAIYEHKINLRYFLPKAPQSRQLSKRIIPCLDIKDGRTVKGINFLELRDAGDPVEQAKAYSDQGADELVFLDISATNEKRKTLRDLVHRVAEQVNIPFTVGGGISSSEDVSRLLESGADKISINSAAVRQPELINELSKNFGAQCITVAIDAKQINGQWKVHLNGGSLPTEIDLFEWAKEVADRGAGEILFTSMDHDGTKGGFANAALARLGNMLQIPIIASGGAGTMEHFKETFEEGKADAALAASIFHYNEIGIPELKKYLSNQNIPIRL
jgi:cyclase